MQKLKNMVEKQLIRRGITDDRVLDAFRSVDRADFVPDDQKTHAYVDRPLPIGQGQTISQPYVVALMTQSVNPAPDDKVLEIGTGSGYQAAILAHLCDHVYTIERHGELTNQAKENLSDAGIDNVTCKTGDGTNGWPSSAPYDAILVTAGGPEIPQPLIDQLAIGGRLVMPVGSQQRRGQELIRLTKTGDQSVEKEKLTGVAFVPLVGEHGHDSEHDRKSGIL